MDSTNFNDSISAPRKYHEKEAFVTGHNGTTCIEILLLCMVAPVGLYLYLRMNSFFARRARRRSIDPNGSNCANGVNGANGSDCANGANGANGANASNGGGGGGGRAGSGGIAGSGGSDRRISYLEDIAMEFGTLIVPMLLVQTSLLPYIVGPLVLMAMMLLLAFILPQQPNQQTNQESNNLNEVYKLFHKPPFLSHHRSTIYLLTTIAILAVDFPLFPRRYCKTETEGFGWMDLGAGSFVIVGGWTHAGRAYSSSLTPRSSQTPKYPSNKPTYKLNYQPIQKAMKKTLPLLFLGTIRLLTNKGLEYQEHVSEYGVHWNFFFTLLFVEGGMLLWRGVRPGTHDRHSRRDRGDAATGADAALALMIMIPYQIYLSKGGQQFIETGPRTCDDGMAASMAATLMLPTWFVSHYPKLCNMYAANREGILGVLGYMSLRLLSEDIARYCIWSVVPAKETNGANEAKDPSSDQPVTQITPSAITAINAITTKRQMRMIGTCSLLWILHSILTSEYFHFQLPTSRRSTNLPFVLWALAHNLFILCVIHWVVQMPRMPNMTNMQKMPNMPKMTIMPNMPNMPNILTAVNNHGLAVFLTSNILTGLINLSMDTLHSSNFVAMGVLLLYLMAVCAVALGLDWLDGLGWVWSKKKME